MQRDRVVDGAADLLLAQRGHDRITLVGEQGVLVVDMLADAVFVRRGQAHLGQGLAVAVGDAAATVIVLVDALEFGAQDHRLHFVEAGVEAELRVVVLLPTAVVAQHTQVLGHLRILGGHQPAVAVAAEVLAGEEAEGAGIAHAAGLLAADVGAEGLGTVLDDFEIMLVGNRLDGRHIRRLAEQVYRDDRLGLCGHGRLDLVRVDIEGLGIDIDEHRRGADVEDRLGGGDEGERGGDDLVAFADASGDQCQVQGVGAGGAADSMGTAQVGSGFFLEGTHVGAEDELGRFQCLQQALVDFIFNRVILTLEVDHWDHCVIPSVRP